MTIKIGDRVRLTADHDGRKAGPEGVVVPGRLDTLHLVKFDPPFKGNGEGEGLWYVPASKLALAGPAAAPGFIVEAGKFYRDADGKKRGPMVGGSFKWEASHAAGRDPEWANDGRAMLGGVDLITEWVEPAAEPVRYKVGDKVRLAEGAAYYPGQDATVSRVDPHDDVMPYLVTVGEDDSLWIYAKDIVGPSAPAVAKVGDWVKDSEGDIGIVFHDDGAAECNLHVGFIAHGGFDYYSAASLTVVPAGTTKAANDNAPILAEIDALQARIDGLRASIA